jgi:tetratricopeptide (TPR) repeat protein
MLSGDAPQFGDAVRLARRAIYDSNRSSNTWGAYQCYGDPGFILQAGAGQAVAQPKRFVAQYEFLLELKNLQSRAARTRDKGWVTRYKNDLCELEDRLTHEFPATWRNGELLAELGDTYAGLGAYEEAIARYQEALSISGPQERVPLRTVEQLANAEAIFAIQLQMAAERGEAQESTLRAEELMPQARKRIDLLIELAPTAERYALLANYHQRRAMAQRINETERNAALTAAEVAYVSMLAQPTVTGREYHNLSQITCRYLRDTDFTDEDRRQTLADLAALEEAVQQREAAEPSFWERIVQPEAALLRALVSPVHGQIVQDEQALLAQYRRVLDVGATTRQYLAVLERLGFMAIILDAKGEADAAAVVARMWKTLE